RKLFLRTPMYVLNGFAGALLVPLLIMLPGLTQDEAITALLGSGLRNPYVGPAAIWGWFPLATAVSLIPATAFSREGRPLWALKCLPISGREVFLGKLLAAETMTCPAAVPGALVLAYVMRLDPAVVVLGIALGALSSVLVAVFSLGVDMARPW